MIQINESENDLLRFFEASKLLKSFNISDNKIYFLFKINLKFIPKVWYL